MPSSICSTSDVQAGDEVRAHDLVAVDLEVGDVVAG